MAMRMKGLEPSRSFLHTDLNRARLPIPPHPRASAEDIARGQAVDWLHAEHRTGLQALVASIAASLAAIVQGTRTPPSHGGNPGSNPGSGMLWQLQRAGGAGRGGASAPMKVELLVSGQSEPDLTAD